MPSTFAPIGLVLLAAGREPSGFSRFFDHVTARLAPFRYKIDGIGPLAVAIGDQTFDPRANVVSIVVKRATAEQVAIDHARFVDKDPATDF